MNRRLGIGVWLVTAALPALAQKGAPRAADGHPDLSGVWTNVTITPLERPRDLAGKEYFTEQEALQYEKAHVMNRDKRPDKGSVTDVNLAYNDFWWDSGTKVVKTRRTSIVIDPPDGRVPALTPERQAHLKAVAEARRARCKRPGCGLENSGQPGPADGPEDRPVMERCLSFGNAAPMLPTAYNNDYEIVQSPHFVGIDVEMVHQMRRIPIDGSPHEPANVREWVGDSRGHWEGDTLVVETKNFKRETSLPGSSAGMHLTERFTRTDPDTLLYEFTVDDPTTWTRPWTAQVPMSKSEEPIYEFACHEGNYALPGILAGARADEKAAEKGTK
jgi:hypothetical protein